jgi:undecaprenyl-diphosphatase
MSILEVIILAIIEGITEFLPISSTGHMIIASTLMGIEDSPFVKLFTVNIQFGAILSVIVLYWKRFFTSLHFYWKILVAFIPAVVFGLLLNDKIDQMLGDVRVVAAALLIGGIILLFVDKWFNKPVIPAHKPAGEEASEIVDSEVLKKDLEQEEVDIPYATAFKIGLFQCISMIPGVSRSAATIVGGMSQGLPRKTAAEFSFFLAVPTMFGASALKLLKGYKEITNDHIPLLLLGNVVAFIVAMMAIKFFISVLTRYGF